MRLRCISRTTLSLMRRYFSALLIAASILFSTPLDAKPPGGCSWWYGDCFTNVWWDDDGWGMSIGCTDGTEAHYSGSGQWGGRCR